MAVAFHVFDREPPPPALTRAWDYQEYGINLFELPAGELNEVRLAGNSFRALNSYKSAAGHTTKWAQANPQAWEFTAHILSALKKERKRLRAMVEDAD